MHIKKTLGIAAVTALLAVPALGATNVSANANPYNVHPTKNFKVFSKSGQLEPFYLHAGENYESLGGVGSNKFISLPGHNGVYRLYTGDANGNGAEYANPADYTHEANNSNSSNATNNVDSSNTKSDNTVATSTNNNSQSGAQNSKLAQTGESNTGAKAGIVGAIAATVSVAFAGVEKFFKRA